MLDFNGLKTENRMVASTAFKYGNGWEPTENPWAWGWMKAGLMSIDDFGLFITKTVTLDPRLGNYIDRAKPWKVIRIYPTKILNRFGWSNCGIKRFVEAELPRLADAVKKKCIVSIGAISSIEEVFQMIEILNGHDIAGIELNISCHNVDLRFLDDLKTLGGLFSGAKKISRHPLIVKINAESAYAEISLIAQSEGINLIHAMNTTLVFSGSLAGYCGQSSYKNKKTALRIISGLRARGVVIPIIGGSGIWRSKDIDDYKKAGADLFSLSHQFLYAPFWPGFLAKGKGGGQWK